MDERALHLASQPSDSTALASDQILEFETFFGREKAGLFRALCLVTRNRFEAEELTQDAFLSVFERWDRVARMKDPTGYLYRTAMNTFRTWHRRSSLAAKRAFGLTPRDDAIERIEDEEVVVRALASLTERQRAAVVLVDLLGYSSEEGGGCWASTRPRFEPRRTRPPRPQDEDGLITVSEYTKLYERAGTRYEVPDLSMEDLLRRRDRKRRNQRIAAGAVGIAVFVAAVWIVRDVTSLNRTQTLVPGGAGLTGPAETGSTAPPPTSGRSLADLPPEGAPPSSPKHGELVVAVQGDSEALGQARTEMYVYADGRLIWWREGAFAEGDNFLHEQHLTAEGVELLRSEVASSGLIGRGSVMVNSDPDIPLPFGGAIAVREDHLDWRSFESAGSFPALVDVGHTACVNGFGCVHYMTQEQQRTLERLDARLADLMSWLPASAWADQEIKTYMPATYQICYGGLYDTIGAADILGALSEPTREPLRGAAPHTTIGAVYPKRVTFYCNDVTSEHTYVILRALGDAGIERGPDTGWGMFEYDFSVPGSGDAQMRIDPLLPHGGKACIPC